MDKVILGGSFNGLEQFAEIIQLGSTGLDIGWLSKRASVSDQIASLRPEKGKTYIHLLALGDGDTYGCNRNGDYFSKEANQKYHSTFVTKAKFFRHHQNKDTDPSYGEVKLSEYNPKMHRVELVVALDNNKAQEELDILEKKGEFPVSMACFLAGTPVRTPCGYTPIENINNGDIVLTHEANWERVYDLQRRGVSEYYSIRLRGWGGAVIRVTGNHEFFATKYVDGAFQPLSWIKAEELSPENYLAVPIDNRISHKCLYSNECLLKHLTDEIPVATLESGLPTSVINVSEEARVELLSKLLAHSGFQDVEYGICWTLNNQYYALDVQRMLAGLGIASRCITFNEKNLQQYTVIISNKYATVFNKYCDFLVELPEHENRIDTFIMGKYLLVPIKVIERIVEPVAVYNFSVENDHSYTVYGIAAHNCHVPYDVCSICDHKAKYRFPKYAGDNDAYCEHAMNYLSKVAADGKQVYVDNEHPSFFDISRVIRPADRIARTFTKVASNSVESGVELALGLGIYSKNKDQLLAKLAGYETDIHEIASKYIKFLTHKRIPSQELNKLASYCATEISFAEILDVLTKQAVLLPIEDFFSLATGSKFFEFRPHIPQVKKAMRGIYTTLLESDGSELDSNIYTLSNNNPSIYKCAKAFSGYSIKPSMVDLMKSAAHNKISVDSGSTLEARNLALEYARYQYSFLTKTAAFKDAELIRYLTILGNYVD